MKKVAVLAGYVWPRAFACNDGLYKIFCYVIWIMLFMDALWIPFFIDALILAMALMVLYGALRGRVFMSGEWHYLNDKSTHFWTVMFGYVVALLGVIYMKFFYVPVM